MSLSAAIPALAAAATDPVRGGLVALATVAVVLVAGLGVGLTLLFRRHGNAPSGGVADAPARDAPGGRSAGPGGTRGAAGGGYGTPGGGAPATATIPELDREAGVALVRADDAVQAAEAEVDFALAQFGPEPTAGFAAAVAAARASVVEAFRIRQQLDDAFPESETARRELARRVTSLANSARSAVEGQGSAFAALRRREADSPARLAALIDGIDSTGAALDAASSTMAQLASRYSPERLSDIAAHLPSATRLLGEAKAVADAVAPRITATGVNTVAADAVSTQIDGAAARVHDARALIAAVAARQHSLAAADAALAELVADTRRDLLEARRGRDTAPDPDSGARIITAIAGVESALAEATDVDPGDADPVDGIEVLGEAVAALDTALAGARNQQQRLEHARTALVGALVAARSQIGATKAYVAGHGGGVDARTRLAEAERQLMLAESESDPVEALDAARRSATAARDADALARYSGL